MVEFYNEITQAIGSTPLVNLSKVASYFGIDATILAKVESFNPGGSVKDRIALNMICDAEAENKISKGATIVEPTSGNTGIGLAIICASRGYKLKLTMPDTMSVERRYLVESLGAEVILTPGAEGMKGAIKVAEQIATENENTFMPSQFSNVANPETHYKTTGPEIWEDTKGEVDAVVAGVGTGGTITGITKYLREKKSSVKAFAVEPATSPVISGGAPGKHGIQGIGAGFIPEVLDVKLLTETILVSDKEAICAAKFLAKTEGIMCGISSGAALHAACEIAKRPDMKGLTIVVILPDTAERYLSTPLFKED